MLTSKWTPAIQMHFSKEVMEEFFLSSVACHFPLWAHTLSGVGGACLGFSIWSGPIVKCRMSIFTAEKLHKHSLDESWTAVPTADLFLNSRCLSHSWLERLAYLKDYLFPFSFHLHLKFPDTPKGMWINVRSGEEYYCDKFIPKTWKGMP